MTILIILAILAFIFGSESERKYVLKLVFFILLLSLIGVPHPITATLGTVWYLATRKKHETQRGGDGNAGSNNQ